MESQLIEWKKLPIDVDINVVFEQYINALKTDKNIIRESDEPVSFDKFLFLYSQVDKGKFSRKYKYFVKMHTTIYNYMFKFIETVKKQFKDPSKSELYNAFHERFRQICVWKCGLVKQIESENGDMKYKSILCMFSSFLSSEYEYDSERESQTIESQMRYIEEKLEKQEALTKLTVEEETTQRLIKMKALVLKRIQLYEHKYNYGGWFNYDYDITIPSKLTEIDPLLKNCADQLETYKNENIKDLELLEEINKRIGTVNMNQRIYEYRSSSDIESLQSKYNKLKAEYKPPIHYEAEQWRVTDFYNQNC